MDGSTRCVALCCCLRQSTCWVLTLENKSVVLDNRQLCSVALLHMFALCQLASDQKFREIEDHLSIQIHQSWIKYHSDVTNCNSWTQKWSAAGQIHYNILQHTLAGPSATQTHYKWQASEHSNCCYNDATTLAVIIRAYHAQSSSLGIQVNEWTGLRLLVSYVPDLLALHSWSWVQPSIRLLQRKHTNCSHKFVKMFPFNNAFYK